MRVGDCKAIRSRAYIAQACCFCQATIPYAAEVVKFVERPSAKSQDVVITYGCLPCWREMRRDLAIDTPTPAERSDRP